ncbi:unnamed protein product [Pseudo-nitzschia multistriata]|uniref:Helicase ATP-binding domain-containing protein n=1 Tax=Pseudo-nitzschia multistriata TaxID=183589 RepID=A0A448ZGN2_9STRA|nr:unnamed protein product [Pseudo-nitzschia multistriata]
MITSFFKSVRSVRNDPALDESVKKEDSRAGKGKKPTGRKAQNESFSTGKTLVKKKLENVLDEQGNPVFLNGVVKKQKYNGSISDGKTYTIQWDGGAPVSNWSESEVAWGVVLFESIGLEISKEFGKDGIFQGIVVDVSRDDSESEGEGDVLYRINYEDGDSEDFDGADLREGIQLHEKVTEKPKRKQAKIAIKDEIKEEKKDDGETTEVTKGRRRSRGRVSYAEIDEDFMDLDSDEEEIKQKRKRLKPSKKKKIADSEDDDFEAPVEDQADTDLDDDMMVDDDDFEEEKTSRSKPTRKNTKTSSRKSTKKAEDKKWASNKSTGNKSITEEFEERLETERKRVKPNNNPQKWPEKGSYVDPVGVDPTHGIVERIVSDQVRKVGGLLQNVRFQQGQKQKDESELSYPIRLQTACSGTDAPSIALGLIKESLARISSKSEEKSDHLFNYEHMMSCEIEPFKQAYIARNFPGTPLFPDITKLSAIDESGSAEKVIDVYGRPQSIPEGDLFVAGTSCKDFSMLKTTKRKDIQDKGQSGETFLAAVEFLDLYQPPFAIFENVDGAPWGKMQEYIQGRIYLPNRNYNKAITSTKRKTNADEDLVFIVNDKGRYEAKAIPPQVGMKAGDIVQGFVKEGAVSSDVIPLLSEENSAGKEFSLGQLAKKHKIKLDKDTLVLEKKARYCTHLCKLDTKAYGLPQTRQRKYLFIWRSDDPDDDLGEYFQEILDHLKSPLLHSMEAFLLPDSHDRIRSFREALRSGPGLMVKRDRAKELDFWEWEISRVKDLSAHKIYREKIGLADRSRWLTGWDTRGRKQLAPTLWPELFDCWNMRRLDMIDCFAAASIRDAISRDPLHHSFSWDLSQNVTRTTFRSATVGVSGCVTPGGELLLPHKGRIVMGYEKLLLQGIPFSRLLLGPETEVQLSDLAGNAMSVSVVSATMLSAICAPQLRKQRVEVGKALISEFALSQKHDFAKGAVLKERGDFYNKKHDSPRGFIEIFSEIAKDLASDAFYSSVLCTCETSGTISKDTKILQCLSCGMSICHSCSDRYKTSSHDLTELKFAGQEGRPDSHKFERRLRCAVPSILRLGKDCEESLEHGEGLDSYSFQLQQVDRKKKHWLLTYGAWEDHGSGRQVAEIRVRIGRNSSLDKSFGISAYIRCFAPAIRNENPLRGKLKDSARLIMSVGTQNSRWELPQKKSTSQICIVGSNPVQSQRSLIELNDDAAKALRNHKIMKSFLPPISSRNPLTHYHKSWKTWPGKIEVSGDASGRINGIYYKMKCEQTVVLSALWRREDKAMYLYIRPDVVRAKLDTAVFAPSPNYDDGLEVCELVDWIPENALNKSTHSTKARFLDWINAPEEMKVEVPHPSIQIIQQGRPFEDSLVAATSHSHDYPVLCELGGFSSEVIQSLIEYSETTSPCESEIDLIGRSGTRNAKRLSIVATPSLLKFAAEGKLPLTLSEWYSLPDVPNLGTCKNHVPPRPSESWKKNSGDTGFVFERFYNAEESNEYYHRLLKRPTAFKAKVSQTDGKLVLSMNPYVAVHRAAAILGGEATDCIDIEYSLSELSSMGEPDTKDFKVPNSDSYVPTEVPELELPLYPRQAKALTRMMDIERGKVKFPEEERSEHILPGVGWCLIGKASKKSPLRGGVLGDAIGSGKTVVTIALILKGAKAARSNRNAAEGRSGATLIVVPPGLVKQWDDERKKFTKDRLKCIIIDCTNKLKQTSVEDMCNADIVIVPAGIIEESSGKTRPYTEHLRKKANADPIPPAPRSHSQREAPSIEGRWVRNMSSGPEIYVGNKGTQKHRDSQAYYGHCYAEAICKLRQKEFDRKERGVPLEYFVWERIVIDECHETLVTNKGYEVQAEFKETARRGAREFLGLSQTNISKRPIVAASGVWGLTGTPLLETEARVTELANLMGGTYLTGAAHHWRKEERESGRDLFLNQQEGFHSREYRCAVQEACHSYIKEACQRNRGEKLEVNLIREDICVNMTKNEGDAFLKQTSEFQTHNSFALSVDELGEKVPDVLGITASSVARHKALTDTTEAIHSKDPCTKIIVFADTSYGGYCSALTALKNSKQPFCQVDENDSVEQQNETISWFRHVDATDEDRKRPRILLLSFSQAAGHNLQEACKHVILFDPVYSGTDAVADASVEEQAVGRVFRQGQKYDVTVTRIVLKDPEGKRCLDDWIMERNLDENVLAAATSNF